MNVLINKKQENFKSYIDKARKTLFEMEVLYSSWEAKNGKVKRFKDTKSLMDIYK